VSTRSRGCSLPEQLVREQLVQFGDKTPGNFLILRSKSAADPASRLAGVAIDQDGMPEDYPTNLYCFIIS